MVEDKPESPQQGPVYDSSTTDQEFEAEATAGRLAQWSDRAAAVRAITSAASYTGLRDSV